MAPPLLLDVRKVARMRGPPDVGDQFVVGPGGVEEGGLVADLHQLAADIVHLVDVEVGEFEGDLQPLLRPLGALQRRDDVGDVIGGDDQAADGALVVVPGAISTFTQAVPPSGVGIWRRSTERVRSCRQSMIASRHSSNMSGRSSNRVLPMTSWSP